MIFYLCSFRVFILCVCIGVVVKMMHIVIFAFVLHFMNFLAQLFDDANIGV